MAKPRSQIPILKNVKVTKNTLLAADCGTLCPSDPSLCPQTQYLQISDLPNSRGSCTNKISLHKEASIFISNKIYSPPSDPQTSNGSLSEPISDLGEGIHKGLEILAPFTEGSLKIYLFKGDHYLLSPFERYSPSAKGTERNNMRIEIR